MLYQASLNGNAQQQQWKITFKYIIGSKNLDKLANEPVSISIKHFNPAQKFNLEPFQYWLIAAQLFPLFLNQWSMKRDHSFV